MTGKLYGWRFATATLLFAMTIAHLLCSPSAYSQASVSTGSIIGTITGPNAVEVPDAAVTIRNRTTGQISETTTNDFGNYNSGSLTPGFYVLEVEAKGFRSVVFPLMVRVATVASGNLNLQPSDQKETVDVESVEERPTTQQATVQGVITPELLEKLPSSRNFLDLTFLEPGVQTIDAQVYDPSNIAFASASVSGRTGRSTRFELDGADVTNEFSGSVILTPSVSSIDQLQVAQSGLDLSTEAAAAGSVNIVTRTGNSSLHGQLLGDFRDSAAGNAKLPGGLANQFQRKVFGGAIGGPIIQERLYGFVAGEYFKQDLTAPVLFNAPFAASSSFYRSPFRQTSLDGRLDYRLPSMTTLFYRFAYGNQNDVGTFNGNNLQLLRSGNNAPSHTLGADFITGKYSHSLRFNYDKYVNSTANAVNASVFDPTALNFQGASGLATGPSPYSPSKVIQGNKQFKYDGSTPWHAHIFRYGVALDRIDGYSFTDRYGLAPGVFLDSNSASQAFAERVGAFTGGASNPLNYPIDSILLGNGAGCSSEKTAYGKPCGGENSTRIQAYFGGTWKYYRNLTLTYGLRYSRETGRIDSDLPAIPCSATAGLGSASPCSGSSHLLDQFGDTTGLGGKIKQPNLDFAPQVGFAWNPGNAGKTVLRGAIGVFYDSTPKNNLLLNRVVRQAKGDFNAISEDPCAAGGRLLIPGAAPITSVDGFDIASQLCKNGSSSSSAPTNLPVGSLTTAIADLQAQYQAASAAVISGGVNPAFVGQTLKTDGIIASNYKTPRSIQFNLGFQREVRAGTVVSLDYVRNVGTHYLQGFDINHVGDSRYLNQAAVLNAINNTVVPAGCGPATGRGSSSITAVSCYLGKVPTANIADFAANGLDSGGQYLDGYAASAFGLTPETGAAFSGVNPNVGRGTMYFSGGRSLYSGLLASVRSQVLNPSRGITSMNLRVSYAYSKAENNVAGGSADQDGLSLAEDFRNTNFHQGPSAEDRTHQVSFGAILNLPWSARLSLLGHFASPLPVSLFLPTQAGVPGEIFRSDVGGDGAFGGQSLTGSSPYGDLVNFTKIGDFARKTDASSARDVINLYNRTYAGQLTPAGLKLQEQDQQFFTASQLQTLGAVTPTLPTLTKYPGPAWLKTFDISLAWPLRVREGIVIEPRVSLFNVFNFGSSESGNLQIGGLLDGQPGNLNGSTNVARSATSSGWGTGVFSQGAPRQFEYGLRIRF